RREQLQITAEVDNDVLIIDEKVELPNNNQRGHLLRQSTLKPSPSEQPSLPKPDNIPANSIDTVKRVVRIIANTPTKESPKKVSIGIQVGPPFKRQPPPVVVPSEEPPLRSYWTHKVNLPYPPAQAPVHQPQLIQQPIHFHHQPTHFQPPVHYHQPEHYYQEQPPIQYPYPPIVQYQVQPQLPRLTHDIEAQLKIIDTFQITTTAVVLLSRKEALEELWSDFRNNTSELENSRDWVGTNEHIEETTKVRELYIRGLAKLTELLPGDANALHESMTMFQRRQSTADMSHSYSDDTNTGTNQDHNHMNMNEGFNNPRMIRLQPSFKLPPVQIKPFSGNELEWPEFKATCENTLTHIADGTCRFHYLKGYLQGEAFKKIRHLPMVTGSYDRAWTILNKVYDKERTIINANLKRLFDLEPVTKESFEALTKMLDVLNECIATVNSYGIETTTWDAILIFRLDESSIQYWEERIQGSNTVPKLSEFIEFLEIRINVLKTIANTRMPACTNTSATSRKPKVLVTATNTKKCTICKKINEHFAFQCPQLTEIPAENRITFISDKGLCINCLYTHPVEKCTSKYSCRECSMRHNTALHPPARIHNIMTLEEGIQLEPEEVQAMEMQNEVILHIDGENRSKNVTLATAIVKIINGNRQILARALIDQAATANVITKRLCEALNLTEQNITLPILSLCDTVAYKVKRKTVVHIQSVSNKEYSLKFPALVVPHITTVSTTPNNDELLHLNGLELADPEWMKGGRIDILLSSAIHSEIIMDGLIKGSPGQPIAQKTELGWIVSGGDGGQQLTASVFTLKVSNEDLSRDLKRFWESEEIPKNKHFTPEEQLAEDIYVKTTKRCDDGRFMVKLPFKTDKPDLGESRFIAQKRYMYMTTRFLSNPALKTIYDKSIHEYLELNHMELAETMASPHNYLPHHPVFKDSSTTTKVRAVYDASCKTSNGNSLNSQLLVGSTLQSDLFSILIHWRKNKYAITGDIEKMYRQIWIDPEHSDYQRILWQAPGTSEIKSYRLKTVTFGVASAPYLAIRTLFLIADDIDESNPKLAAKIRFQFYVDDFFDSVDTIDEAKQVIKMMSETLGKYGFLLRKWKANDSTILDELATSEKDSSPSNVFKTLGIQWQPSSDNFLFIPAELKKVKKWTKRTILSEIAKLFDPLGWLSPCVVTAKMFMQDLWLLQVGWDDELPSETIIKWTNIRQQFFSPCTVKVPRWIGLKTDIKGVSLHGFCDASEKGMSSVTFIRVQDQNDKVSCQLIAAKTKIAPLKKLSIPRLELNAAVLLAKLMEKVKGALKIPNLRQQAWSDSEIVLHWIANHPSRWKTYVAGRVVEIQDLLPSHNWRHIPTAQNPADCASRGLTQNELEKFDLWWYGPKFLLKNEQEWPKTNLKGSSLSKLNLEERKQAVIAAISTPEMIESNIITARFSNYERMLRVITRCLRWKHKKSERSDPISSEELRQTEVKLIKLVQNDMFSTEITPLAKGQAVGMKSSIANLDPYLDINGVLRVGGRIQKSSLPDNAKHPVILPPKHHFTTLLIRHAHEKTLHGGFGLTAQKLYHNFWIVNARTAIKAVIHKCITCFRFKKKLLVQKMGEIPAYRLEETVPFTFTGVDYAGYFDIKSSQRKNAPYVKGYVAVFVCLTTRAIHLEIVSDLSTETFMKAFKRFIGRRGIPKRMFSDNATNFIGAVREIQEMLDLALSQVDNELNKELTKNRIVWSTIPARAPHFGGWESSVKLMKHHLKRVLGNVRLCFEDFNTLIIEIEAIVNSRPLWAIPTQVDDIEALTPGHFLVGKALNTLPEPELGHIPLNRLSHYQYLNRLKSDFWRLWSKEYIQTLQTRKKWMNNQPNVRIGQIVLVSEDNEPVTCWSLGKIIQTHPGSDGLVRAVDVLCRSKSLRRPIHKLSLLPIEDNNKEDSTDAALNVHYSQESSQSTFERTAQGGG
ncbi:uncharacterized protein LOC129572830, partial [Sitodiplosis mosellana]|uniref:uncharacterized protein LOC129572830 n=1 Tax=Sitodiplosis mosellana TaxID=263140 RepID=UPI0024437685